MPQSTAVLASWSSTSPPPADAEAVAVHFASKNWDTPEQVRAIGFLRLRNERLADELRIAIQAFR